MHNQYTLLFESIAANQYTFIYCAICRPTVGNFVFDEIYIQYQNLYSKCQ